MQARKNDPSYRSLSRIPFRTTRNLSPPIAFRKLGTILGSNSGDDEPCCVKNSDTNGTNLSRIVKGSKDSFTSIEAPSMRNIISFAIPAMGIWLCGPLLSLIDTSAVGMLSGTSQLAALNPAITITDDGALLVVSKEREHYHLVMTLRQLSDCSIPYAAPNCNCKLCSHSCILQPQT